MSFVTLSGFLYYYIFHHKDNIDTFNYTMVRNSAKLLFCVACLKIENWEFLRHYVLNP